MKILKEIGHCCDRHQSFRYFGSLNTDTLSKDLFYYVDDVEGDMFVSDINDARIFTGKQVKSFQLDSAFDIGNEIYCDEEGGYITLTEKPIRIEV